MVCDEQQSSSARPRSQLAPHNARALPLKVPLTGYPGKPERYLLL